VGKESATGTACEGGMVWEKRRLGKMRTVKKRGEGGGFHL
jgi:hypothetical protein